MKPLAVDLFCGLGGWAEGLLAEGYDVVGFDIERHRYPGRTLPESDGIKAPGCHVRLNKLEHRKAPLTGRWVEYPGQLVIQDVRTLHGSQFKDAALIVASPPCQAYSWMAMPWKLAKAKAEAIRADESGQMLADLNVLFHECFRIQKEASVAAGRHVPMVVENVRGAQRWVGRARWNFGSYYLWGDVPALMPFTAQRNAVKQTSEIASPRIRNEILPQTKLPGFRFDGSGRSFQTASVEGMGDVKLGGSWFHGYRQGQGARNHGSKSSARKAASATIAKIPLPLARHIARIYADG